jgi:predicted glycogen debranching enzyme
MTYIQFDKTRLINLEYSLNKEILRSNRAGSYASTTIIGCNTRKYHGLLVCPMEQLDGEKHVLLSTLDETVIQHGSEFNLGIHKYPGDQYFPKGHKYVRDFEVELVAKTTYRVGGVILTKESLMVEKEEQVLLKYTLVDAHSPTILRFKPFLAFRNFHTLMRANMNANTRVEASKSGNKIRLYPGYPYLHMQFNKEPDFIVNPDWYYNIEYIEEMRRGYEFQEDLFVPGYFELPIKKGETIIFSASIKEADPKSLKRKFESELKNRLPRSSFHNCLQNAAQQFIERREKKTEIVAGFPWFGSWGRDTFVSLPGLTLATDDPKTFRAIIDTQIAKMKGGLFPNTGPDSEPAFNSVDAPLWFFWALQQFAIKYEAHEEVWTKYGKAMKVILEAYRDGAPFNIKMHDNGLIFAGEAGKSLTWMDAVVHGKPVNPRIGFPVEINGLWYNALMFTLELARKSKDNKFISQWKHLPEKIKDSFLKLFWDPERGYCADVVQTDYADFSLRPNMVIAASLPYTPLEDEMIKKILDLTQRELLTPRGLRTLSPNDPAYIGIYEGNQEERDRAYHNGTAWPWLLQHYAIAWAKLYKAGGISHLRELFDGFESVLGDYGVGTVGEIFDGDPPFNPRGSISQAWSVGSLLIIDSLIKNLSTASRGLTKNEI